MSCDVTKMMLLPLFLLVSVMTLDVRGDVTRTDYVITGDLNLDDIDDVRADGSDVMNNGNDIITDPVGDVNVEDLRARQRRGMSHENREKVITEILQNSRKNVPPNFEDDEPTNVTIQLYIVGLHSISETSMDYSVTVFLRQRWRDKRMQFRSHAKNLGVDKLELDATSMDQVWVPDLFFTNEKKASFHKVTVPNKLMQVEPEGDILYSSRVSMTLSCDMDLRKFPFDKQLCSLVMESYSYTTDNVVFQWIDVAPVEQRKNLKMAQFSIDRTDTEICTKTYNQTGSFTCIRADFHLVRNYGYYIAQVYTPSVLIVMLSWVSFWLDSSSVPARVTMGLVTILTMTHQSESVRSRLPKVAYIKAIDVWMAMCLFFVFAGLIEFAYVNVNARVERRRTTMKDSQGGLQLGSSGKGGGGEKEGKESTGIRSWFAKSDNKAKRMDQMSRILFPAVFFFFNLVYWSFYMNWDHTLHTYDRE